MPDSSDGRVDDAAGVTHRALYTLEKGAWYATCKTCGFRISDSVRGRTATAFRNHIRSPALIDLREESQPPANTSTAPDANTRTPGSA